MVRSANGDDIVVGSLSPLQGAAPLSVRCWSSTSPSPLSVAIVAGTGTSYVFGILVPMLPIGLVGLWGARHGSSPSRPDRTGADVGSRSTVSEPTTPHRAARPLGSIPDVADEAHEHITVGAPSERCYAVAADFERYPDWART